MTKALCQDCLRIADVDYVVAGGEAVCPCGGDMCSCSECMNSANLLLRGCRQPAELGLHSHVGVIRCWSPSVGCCCEE